MKGPSILDLFSDKWTNCVNFINESAASVVGPSTASLIKGILDAQTPEGALLLLAEKLPPHRERIEQGDFGYFRARLCEMLRVETINVPEAVEQKLLAYARFFQAVLDEIAKNP
jgi:hypothetical protein